VHRSRSGPRGPLSGMTHRESLERLFAEWRAGDALRSGAHFALDATYHEASREPIAGRTAIVAHFTRFFRDGPAWEFHADDIIVEGDRAAIRYRFATVSGEGERAERSGCAFVTFKNGTIAEWREYEG
jgi:ketosteroid isomerase-like protein